MGGEETVKEKQERDGGEETVKERQERDGGEEIVKERQERDGGRANSEGEAGEGWREKGRVEG